MLHPSRWVPRSHHVFGLLSVGAAMGIPYWVFAQVRPAAQTVVSTDAGLTDRARVGVDAPGASPSSRDAGVALVSRADAQAACAPQVLPLVAPDGMIGCRRDSECVIRMSSCCPPCGWRANLYRAVNVARQGAYARLACPEQFAPGLRGGVGCGDCAGGPPRGLRAVCVARQCRMEVPAERRDCRE